MSSDSFEVGDGSTGEAAPQTPPNRENINESDIYIRMSTTTSNRLPSPPLQGPLQGTRSSSSCTSIEDLSRTENLPDILRREIHQDSEEGFVARTTISSNTFHSSNVHTPLLDFPIMTAQSSCPGSSTSSRSDRSSSDSLRAAVDQVSPSRSTLNGSNNLDSNRTFSRNSNAESGTTSVAAGTSSSHSLATSTRWNSMTLNRETVRYHTHRRRASSFDELPPVPRVSLRPRFTRHFDLSLVPATSRSALSPSSQHQPNLPNCTCMECIMNSLSSEYNEDATNSSAARPSNNNLAGFLHIDHEATTRQLLPLRMHHPHPTRQRHFRNHTYGGSDSSTDIFSLAMELEQSTTDQRQYSNGGLASSSQEPTATVPIIHPNPFELSSLNRNLPPAVQAFMAPCNPVNTTSTSSANITRPIPRHRKNLGLGETTFLNSIHSSIPRTRPSSNTASSNQHVIAATTTTTAITNNASPSLGTPTCTCTLSTSSVSAFDQTYSPQWQDNASPGGSIFQGLKDHSSVHSSTSSVKRGRENNVECTETNVNAKRMSHDNVGQHKSTLPFDEVHLLINHTGDENSNSKTASPSEEDCHGKRP